MNVKSDDQGSEIKIVVKTYEARTRVWVLCLTLQGHADTEYRKIRTQHGKDTTENKYIFITIHIYSFISLAVKKQTLVVKLIY